MTNRQVLLLIAAFVALTLGSFIWYIATWDSRKGSDQTTLIILPEILPPEAPVLATGTKL
ncbi:hypothetical protein [Yoonia sp. R78084]|uniref:hypothetical protein n=1 Tax=Yoonia sp. R78084 TaxID=3093869 RepID=UPI0037DDC225